MQCLVCGETLEKEKSWEHLRGRHLAPFGVTQEMVFHHARMEAQPLELKIAYLTCINLKRKCIYFSLENAELLIAYGFRHGSIPWTDIVEWQILHEKGHLTCRGLYDLPESFRFYVLANAEDYYINRYLIPERYWPVCVLNARCATEIRNIAPMPYELRDGYYYCTLATFIAYGAVTFGEIRFLKPSESKFVDAIAKYFGKIKGIEDILVVTEVIGGIFARLYPPRGVSWDNWDIPEPENNLNPITSGAV